MKKRTFIPKSDQLESRVVLSGTPKFIHGAAVLTTRAMGQTYAQIQGAFSQYATHGQNLKHLESTLAGAVSRIPWSKRDGLLATVESLAPQMRADIADGVGTSVQAAMQRRLAGRPRLRRRRGLRRRHRPPLSRVQVHWTGRHRAPDGLDAAPLPAFGTSWRQGLHESSDRRTR